MRILITGASGSGTTALAHALASKVKFQALDCDEYFWLPSDPPYQERRKAEARLSLILADLLHVPNSVLSGSEMRWGAELENSFELIVFLILDSKIRIARLREREVARFGRADPEFIEWAAQYDEGRLAGRSRPLHEAWLAERSCPILRLEGDLSIQERVARVMKALPNMAIQRT